MKDAEQIYALYVQANPVPDPDLLPLTRDETVLLSVEGSNSADTPYSLIAWLLSGDALAEELEWGPVGTDWDRTDADTLPQGEAVMGLPTRPGESQSLSMVFSTGTHLIDCVIADHVWRPARIEVVAP